jgi:hypothetical protein
MILVGGSLGDVQRRCLRRSHQVSNIRIWSKKYTTNVTDGSPIRGIYEISKHLHFRNVSAQQGPSTAQLQIRIENQPHLINKCSQKQIILELICNRKRRKDIIT